MSEERKSCDNGVYVQALLDAKEALTDAPDPWRAITAWGKNISTDRSLTSSLIILWSLLPKTMPQRPWKSCWSAWLAA